MSMEVVQEFSFMKDVPIIHPKEKDYFFEGYFKGKSRPNSSSKEVIMLVVQKIMPKIIEWFEKFEKLSEKDIDNIKEQLTEAFDRGHGENDGYEIAKILDNNYYWDSDSDLVEVLDDSTCYFYDAKSLLIKKWINDNNINPKYKIGDNIAVKSSNLRKKDRQKEQYSGEIIKIYDDGKYSIFIEELGHVRKGEGTHGVVLDWEKID